MPPPNRKGAGKPRPYKSSPNVGWQLNCSTLVGICNAAAKRRWIYNSTKSIFESSGNYKLPYFRSVLEGNLEFYLKGGIGSYDKLALYLCVVCQQRERGERAEKSEKRYN